MVKAFPELKLCRLDGKCELLLHIIIPKISDTAIRVVFVSCVRVLVRMKISYNKLSYD
jgi:hypothetical protein